MVLRLLRVAQGWARPLGLLVLLGTLTAALPARLTAQGCSTSRTHKLTILFVNGILNTRQDAEAGCNQLAGLAWEAGIRNVNIDLFYNRTRSEVCSSRITTGAVGVCPQEEDLVEAAAQYLNVLEGFPRASQEDAARLSDAIEVELQAGRAVLLVAHSQGNLMVQEALFGRENAASLAPELSRIGWIAVTAPYLESSPAIGSFNSLVAGGDVLRLLRNGTPSTRGEALRTWFGRHLWSNYVNDQPMHDMLAAYLRSAVDRLPEGLLVAPAPRQGASLAGRVFFNNGSVADGWHVLVLSREQDFVLAHATTQGSGTSRAGSYTLPALPAGVPMLIAAADPQFQTWAILTEVGPLAAGVASRKNLMIDPVSVPAPGKLSLAPEVVAAQRIQGQLSLARSLASVHWLSDPELKSALALARVELAQGECEAPTPHDGTWEKKLQAVRIRLRLLEYLANEPASYGVPASATCGTTPGPGSPSRTRRVLVVLDLSGSMQEYGKLDEARSAIDHLLQEVGSRTEVGIMTFGGRAGANCAIGAPQPFTSDHEAIRRTLAGLAADGGTPLAAAIRQAATFAAHERDAGPLDVVVVSDGQETCSGDPVAAARELGEALFLVVGGQQP